MAKKEKSRWGTVIWVLVILFIVAYIISGLISLAVEDIKVGNVAVIPIKGVIMTDSEADFFSQGNADSTVIVKDIEDALGNPQIKAILLEINSPGGAPVATDEISRAVIEANVTTVAWIREVGASGAYWVASSTDYVVANRMSIIGSIGVIGSYLDFSGLMADYNVSYERLVGGEYKDTGVPFRRLTDEERKMLQRKIDLIHQEFKDVVQENRGLSNSEIEAIGTGEFYLGSEGINIGMVDELGGKEEALAYIKEQIGEEPKLVRYEHKESFFDLLAGVLSRNGFKAEGASESILLK